MAKGRRVLIVGAGASGLAAAVAAARCGALVTVLEHMETAGKKLLVTGNGHCNYTNTALSPRHYHGDAALIASVLSRFDTEACLRFFETLGVYSKIRRYGYDDGGYVYPASGEAASVRDALLREAEGLGVHLIYGCTPLSLSQCSDINTAANSSAPLYLAQTRQGSFEAEAVILASGSNAAPQTGSDSSLYPVLRALGIPFKTFRPALCQINCREPWMSVLKGVRAEAKVILSVCMPEPAEREGEETAFSGGKPACFEENKNQTPAADKVICSAFGEVQFNETGVSGIPVFQLSRFVPLFFAEEKQRKRALKAEVQPLMEPEAECGRDRKQTARKEKPACGLKLTLDFAPRTEAEELQKLIEMLVQKGQGLCGLLPHKLARLLREQETTAAAIARRLKAFELTPTGTGGFASAQCCSGGIPAEALLPSLELKNWKGLYAAGELLDVDGDCGGYNLHWAFATGVLAGTAAALS